MIPLALAHNLSLSGCLKFHTFFSSRSYEISTCVKPPCSSVRSRDFYFELISVAKEWLFCWWRKCRNGLNSILNRAHCDRWCNISVSNLNCFDKQWAAICDLSQVKILISGVQEIVAFNSKLSKCCSLFH